MACCNSSICVQNSKSLGYTCFEKHSSESGCRSCVGFWNLFNICVGLYHWFGSDTDCANLDCAGLRSWCRNLENKFFFKPQKLGSSLPLECALMKEKVMKHSIMLQLKWYLPLLFFLNLLQTLNSSLNKKLFIFFLLKWCFNLKTCITVKSSFQIQIWIQIQIQMSASNRDWPIQNIKGMWGFSSLYYFNNTFKRLGGVCWCSKASIIDFILWPVVNGEKCRVSRVSWLSIEL